MNELIPDSMTKADEVSEKASRMAGHKHKTAKKHYILESGNPEYDALISKAYIQVFKGPLPPLTAEQIDAQQNRTADDVLKDFARLAKKPSAKTGSKEDNVHMTMSSSTQMGAQMWCSRSMHRSGFNPWRCAPSPRMYTPEKVSVQHGMIQVYAPSSLWSGTYEVQPRRPLVQSLPMS